MALLAAREAPLPGSSRSTGDSGLAYSDLRLFEPPPLTGAIFLPPGGVSWLPQALKKRGKKGENWVDDAH